MGFDDTVAAFLANPTSHAVYELRRAIQQDPHYAPSGSTLITAAALLEEGKAAKAVGMLAATRQANFLSPRGHLLFSKALAAAGEHDLAALEADLSDISLQTLLVSGSGERSRPYVVLRLSDEYDILAALEREPVSQGVRLDGSRVVDEFVFDDDSSLNFELFRGGGAGGHDMA